MNSKFILRVLRSTKKGGSGSMIPVAIMAVFLASIFTVYMFRVQLIQFNHSKIDNCVTSSLLASAIINLHEFARTGNIVIEESDNPTISDTYFDNAYNLFTDILKTNLGLDDEWRIENTTGIMGYVEVDEFAVYNYVKHTNGNFQIISIHRSNGNTIINKYAENEDIFVYVNGEQRQIKETSVYAKVSFQLQLMGSVSLMNPAMQDLLTGDYSVTRMVAVTDR